MPKGKRHSIIIIIIMKGGCRVPCALTGFFCHGTVNIQRGAKVVEL